ncbi:SH3 domain-containing protein [Streptomyces gelaticus]
MTIHNGVLTKAAMLAAVGIAFTGLTTTSASAQAQVAAAPAYIKLTALETTPIYAGPSSSSSKIRTVRAGTTLSIACQTTKTPSGRLWYRLYNHTPKQWAWAGHFESPFTPPKEC